MKKILRRFADIGIVTGIAVFGGFLMIITAVNMLIKKVKDR